MLRQTLEGFVFSSPVDTEAIHRIGSIGSLGASKHDLITFVLCN